MTQKRASSDALDALHALVAEALTEQINAWKAGRLVDFAPKNAEDGDPGVLVAPDGQLYVKVFPPALLAQAIKFLSENGIDMPAASGNRVDTLKDAMPDFDELEGGKVVPIRR